MGLDGNPTIFFGLMISMIIAVDDDSAAARDNDITDFSHSQR